jgi:SPP1 gp7 family putative phage head morphogenesis protein
MEIELNQPFARNGKVDDYDVRRMKKALNQLGYYYPYEKTGITGIPDAEIFEALKNFQKDQGMKPTGTAKPDDETVDALNEAAAQPKKGRYIWRTVGDKKVRPEHATLEGVIRSWDDDFHPGDDFNCRCWAVPVSDEIEKEELPPPKKNIPGTNIPDRGIPEGGLPRSPFIGDPDIWRYRMDTDIEKQPPIFDPHILIPHNPDYPVLIPRRRKQEV